MKHTIPILAAAASALGAAAPQDLAPQHAPAAAVAAHDLRLPWTGVIHSETAEGAWAAAPRWKALFQRDGTTFVPFHGSEQPRNAPLRFRVASIAAGGRELACEASSVSRVVDRIELERGAVDEAWQLTSAGAEQLFVITEPQGPGELVVRVAFEGEYTAEEDAAGILFRGELGDVRYGLAFAFDADGLRVEVPERLVDGAIELRVPAGFLARARFPVTLDPIVHTLEIETGPEECLAPDVAYEDSTGGYLYVYERVFSQTDHDVYTVLATDAGVVPGSSRTIDSSSVNWTHARVASNRRATSFLVVAEVGIPGLRSIRGRLVDAASLVVGPELAIASSPTGERIRPDVGGDPRPAGGSNYCIVWEHVASAADHDIHGSLLDPSSGATQATFAVSNPGVVKLGNPAISSSAGIDQGGSEQWTVVWEHEVSSSDHDIHGARIRWDGEFLGSSFPIANTTHDDVAPAVSPTLDEGGTLRPYLVTWERWMGPSERDVMVVGMVGSELHSVLNLSADQPQPAFDDFGPRVETDGRLFGLAYAKKISAADADVRLNWLHFTGGQVARVGSYEDLSSSGFPELSPAIVSERSGGGGAQRMAVVAELHSGIDVDIRAVIVDSPPSFPLEAFCNGTSLLCPCGGGSPGRGCPNSVGPGAQLSASGHALVSDDTLVLTTSGLPATATCLFLQGTLALNGGAGVPFGDGLRCAGGAVIRLGTKVGVGGVASYPGAGEPAISERGALPAAGATRYYQAWYRDPAASCTASTSNLSNGLKAFWVH